MDDDWLHHQISDNWYNQLLENPKANKIYKNIRLNARINPGTNKQVWKIISQNQQNYTNDVNCNVFVHGCSFFIFYSWPNKINYKNVKYNNHNIARNNKQTSYLGCIEMHLPFVKQTLAIVLRKKWKGWGTIAHSTLRSDHPQ